MTGIRPPAVAGIFYPADPAALRASVERFLRQGRPGSEEPEEPEGAGDLAPGSTRGAAGPRASPSPRAVVSPHAGYIYSGPVAGSAYRALLPKKERIRRVVVMGPSHYVPLEGAALPEADLMETPLGTLPVDPGAVATLEGEGIPRWALPHRDEHSLEVQFPFIQVALDGVSVVPLVVGQMDPRDLAGRVAPLLDGETLLVVSSDLSHYLPHARAARVDGETAAAVEALDADAIHGERACGHVPLRALLEIARRRGWRARTLDLRTSADTAGDPGRVVGYGAFAFAPR
ncbi:MAG: AmmeMemoRadiSam system protein B [Gemmatimonadota bacterium]